MTDVAEMAGRIIPTLQFGVLARPLDCQLDAVIFPYDPKTVGQFDADMRAIARLKVRGLTPESATKAAYARLARRLDQHLRAHLLSEKEQ